MWIKEITDELAILDTCARLYGENDGLYQMFGKACANFGTEVLCEAFTKTDYPYLWEIFNKNI